MRCPIFVEQNSDTTNVWHNNQTSKYDEPLIRIFFLHSVYRFNWINGQKEQRWLAKGMWKKHIFTKLCHFWPHWIIDMVPFREFLWFHTKIVSHLIYLSLLNYFYLVCWNPLDFFYSDLNDLNLNIFIINWVKWFGSANFVHCFDRLIFILYSFVNTPKKRTKRREDISLF